MMNCIVVDDEPAAIEILASYIEQTPFLHLLESFRDPLQALEHSRNQQISVAFLDIDMPGLTGLQLANLLAGNGVGIVFCSAYPEFAVESYEQGAVDYLLKPVPFERFLKATERLHKRFESASSPSVMSEKETGNIFIKSGSVIHQVEINDLRYMKKDGHYVTLVTGKGSLLSRMTMEELLDALPNEQFQRVHKSFVVALKRVAMVHRHHLIVDGEEIPIGGNYRKELLDRIHYSGS